MKYELGPIEIRRVADESAYERKDDQHHGHVQLARTVAWMATHRL